MHCSFLPDRPARCRARLLVALVGVVTLVVACGQPIETTGDPRTTPGDDVPGESPPSGAAADAPGRDLSPAAAALDAAVVASAERQAVRTTTTVTMDGHVMNRSTMTHGPDARGRGTMDVPHVGEVELLVLPEGVYFAFPELPAGLEWVVLAADEVHEMTGVEMGAAADPLHGVLRPSQISGDVTVVGAEHRDGTTVTHYRMTADLDEVMRLLTEAGMLTDDGTTGDTFGDDPVVDLLVDAEGLLRGQSFELQIPEGPAGGPATLRQELRYDYPAEAPVVTTPAPQTVVSFSQLMQMAG